MEEFFRSGMVADVILVVMIAEALLLLLYRRVTGRGVAARDLFAMLLAGACLVLALRAVLTGSSWPVVALCLGAALIAHLMDLYRRWPRRAVG
jgi:O-antigen ligase